MRKGQELWNGSLEQVPPKLDILHPLNAHADVSHVSSRAKGLKFGLSIHILCKRAAQEVKKKIFMLN